MYTVIEGGVTAAAGFQTASTAAGIKYKNRKDMAMIYSEKPCKAAGTFTTNIVKAAPVKLDQKIVKEFEYAQAVVINAGIANACTGAEGMGYCAETAQAASAALDALNSDDNKDLTASFGSLTENPDYNTAFMNLDSGAADAIAVDIGVAKYQLSQREEGKYVILDEPIQSEQYGIGFKKGNDELKDTVWAEVLKLYDAGEVDKLAEKYEVADMLCIGSDDEESADKKDDAAEEDTSEAETSEEDTAEDAE